ncbi:hypothetical protein AS888_11920 [Peribacillus simplex]|uniref:Uncharacterized protein n=1 Tax=Peribacillus simplex TaxID=1478 RepID=A0A109N2Y3_9BACI|nr:hypothetical protein AS888_11920 [Peribacillus simplex]
MFRIDELFTIKKNSRIFSGEAYVQEFKGVCPSISMSKKTVTLHTFKNYSQSSSVVADVELEESG